MKLCAACSLELPQESFSKKQWQLKKYRRCKGCIDANHGVQLPSPKSTAIPGQLSPSCAVDHECASCWICLGEGPDESGKPLRRDCSCRGDSGFCHLSCILKYAKQKSDQWDGKDIDDFTEPWDTCYNCHQPYQNKLAENLASEFVTFVEQTYPGDGLKQLEALAIKLDAFPTQPPKKKKVLKQIANKMLSIIGQMKSNNSLPSRRTGSITFVLPKRIINMEAHAYNCLGIIAFQEGTEKGTKTAVEYYEKARCISKATDWVEGITVAENNLSFAKFRYEEGSKTNDKEKVAKRRKMYALYVKKLGQENTSTIEAGVKLAKSLKNVFRSIEAERLLVKLAATSKQVHGSSHCVTGKVESEFQDLRYVDVKYQRQLKLFQALRYEEGGRKCVVQGPISEPRNIRDEEVLTFVTKDLVYCAEERKQDL